MLILPLPTAVAISRKKNLLMPTATYNTSSTSGTYHDGERGRVHAGAEEDAEDADDHGPALVRVRQAEH